MAKGRMEWFKFDILKWLTGDIQYCSKPTQSDYIILCCHYAKNSGVLNLNKAAKIISQESIDELVDDGIIRITDNYIAIDFLDEQLSGFQAKSDDAKRAADIRWEKERKAKDMQTQSNINADAMQSKSIEGRVEGEEEKSRAEKTTSNEVGLSSGDSVFMQILNHYNLNRGNMRECRAMNDFRKKRIKKLLKEYTVDDILAMIDKAGQSDYWQGKVKKNFVGTFDWIMRDGNFINILEGSFDNEHAGRVSWDDMVRDINEEHNLL